MARPTIKDYLTALSPFQQPYGLAWSRSIGDVVDNWVSRALQAVKARFPLIAPDDALSQLGAERGIDKGVSESSSSYAARIQAAWTTWPWAGTAYGMLSAFKAAGYPRVIIEQVRTRQFQLNANGDLVVTTLPAGSWLTDAMPGYPGRASNTAYALGTYVVPSQPNGHRYQCTVTGTTTQAEPTWPTTVGGTVADGSVTWTEAGDDAFWSKFEVIFDEVNFPVWGGVPPSSVSDEANRIRGLISKWKPAHATCNAIRIITVGGVWGYPQGTWNDGTTWGGDTVATWAP